MARADEIRQPVVGAVHLAHDIGARPQIEIDEAVPAELISERRVDERCDVVVETGRRRERGTIDALQLRERRIDCLAMLSDRVQRAVVELAAQRRMSSGIELETGCLFRAAAQLVFGETLQQRRQWRLCR
jgi:hypothetical protein